MPDATPKIDPMNVRCPSCAQKMRTANLTADEERDQQPERPRAAYSCGNDVEERFGPLQSIRRTRACGVRVVVEAHGGRIDWLRVTHGEDGSQMLALPRVAAVAAE